MEEFKSRFAPIVIFVRPQAAGNIGALARAMSNFCCPELRLVGNGPVYPHREDDPFSKMDWAMATKRGEELLTKARWYPTFADSLADIHLAVGSSGRHQTFPKGYARPIEGPDEVYSSVLADIQKSVAAGHEFRWALVIGPEDDGLSTEEAALCRKLIHLPTADASPSINAAVAAACMLYHWFLVESAHPVLSESKTAGAFLEKNGWASIDQNELFLDYLMETMRMTALLKFPDEEAIRSRLRRWVQSAPIPVHELLFAFEILYNLRAWGTGKFEGRDFLKSRRPIAPIPSGAPTSNE